MTPIAQSIAADRQRLGLSQHDLAKALGVSQQSVSKWEEGKSLPRGKRAHDLVAALGKKSHTAQALASRLLPSNYEKVGGTTRMGKLATPAVSQADALATLARAAQDLAVAAQTIAQSVHELVAHQQPPPPSE